MKRKDFVTEAQILNLIIRYELNQLDLIEYNMKSSERLIKAKGLYFKVEASFFKLLKSIIKDSSGKNRLMSFEKFKSSILEITVDKIEQNGLTMFPFLLWAESNIQEKNMDEVFSPATDNSIYKI